MKITIKKKDEIIRVYHHPQEVILDSVKKIIMIGGERDRITYNLAKPPEVKWERCENSTFDEIFVEFEVE